VQLSYIKNLSKAYIIDNKLYEGENVITEDELTENFDNVINVLKSDHLNLYNIINEANVYEQQKIFKDYFDLSFNEFQEIILDDSELETLTEMPFFGLEIPVFTTLMIAYPFLFAFSKNIGKGSLRLIIGIANRLGKMGKWCSKLGDSTRIAYAIINHNSNSCLKRCKYDPKKAGSRDIIYQLRQGSSLRSIARTFMGIEKEESLDCIRTCYIEKVHDTTKLAADMYFQCLRNTGDLSRLPLEKDFTTYQRLIVRTKINSSCDTFVKLFSDSLKTYNDSLDVVYNDEPNERRKLKVKLMEDIYSFQRKNSQDRSKSKSNMKQKSNWQPKKRY